MSLDTSAKRLSALNPCSPWRGPSSRPTGTITTSVRSALIGLYSALPFAITYSLVALSGMFGMSGNTATLTPTLHINTGAKRFSAINIGNPWRGLNRFPTGTIDRNSRITLAGFYSGLGQQSAYTMTCLPGSFFMDAEPAFSDFEIAATHGSFTMTGNSATLIATRTLFAQSGTFVMTGNQATLLKFTTRTMMASPGAFSMTGNPVSFAIPRRLTAAAGIFTMTGNDALLTWANANGDNHQRPPGQDGSKGPRKKRLRFYTDNETNVNYETDEEEDPTPDPGIPALLADAEPTEEEQAAMASAEKLLLSEEE